MSVWQYGDVTTKISLIFLVASGKHLEPTLTKMVKHLLLTLTMGIISMPIRGAMKDPISGGLSFY